MDMRGRHTVDLSSLMTFFWGKERGGEGKFGSCKNQSPINHRHHPPKIYLVWCTMPVANTFVIAPELIDYGYGKYI